MLCVLPPQVGWQPSLPKLKKKWLFPASCSFFFLLSVVMTGCFLWQYHLPKLDTSECTSILDFLPIPVGPGSLELTHLI